MQAFGGWTFEFNDYCLLPLGTRPLTRCRRAQLHTRAGSAEHGGDVRHCGPVRVSQPPHHAQAGDQRRRRPVLYARRLGLAPRQPGAHVLQTTTGGGTRCPAKSTFSCARCVLPPRVWLLTAAAQNTGHNLANGGILQAQPAFIAFVDGIANSVPRPSITWDWYNGSTSGNITLSASAQPLEARARATPTILDMAAGQGLVGRHGAVVPSRLAHCHRTGSLPHALRLWSACCDSIRSSADLLQASASSPSSGTTRTTPRSTTSPTPSPWMCPSPAGAPSS